MSTIIQDRRIGRMQLDIALLNADPEAVRAVMGTVIILDARPDLALGKVDYVAICDDFDALRVGDEPAQYMATLHRSDDGRVRVIGWSRA